MIHQNNFINKEEAIWSICFSFLFIVAFFIYFPGTSGIFIFDDIPNLSPMGKYIDYSFWDNFWLFLLEGNSGPTGRPISLASFFLNDTAWPSKPSGFILTNILIHLFNGILVFWFCLKLSKILRLSTIQQIIFSLVITAFWLLHPMHTTTVLYVIQRMTELSATFTLLGLIFYLYGRERLIYRKKTGLLILFLGVGLSLLLAILSKENGILLVAYILVIEFFLLQPLKHQPPQYFYTWLIPAVIIPFIAIIIYLGMRTNPSNFIDRDFTLIERLLTEPRILFNYIKHIFIPDMSYISIFHDDYHISKNLFTPWTTLPAIIGVVSLVIGAFLIRKKHPLIAFSFAWFFVGHLIESTVLPLELYFEHRNYIPMLGFFISIILFSILSVHKKFIFTFLGLILAINSFVLYQNTTLWGSPLELGINWFESHPKSERSRLLYVSVVTAAGGKIEPSNKNSKPIIKENSQFHSTSALLELKNACLSDTLTNSMLVSTVQTLKNSIIHVSARVRFVEFILLALDNKCENLDKNKLEQFLLQLADLDSIKKHKFIAHDVHYYLSLIYKNKKDFNAMMVSLDKAYLYEPSIEVLKRRAIYLATAGLYDQALKTLDETTLLKTTYRNKLIMRIRQKELDQLKSIILKAMHQQSKKGQEEVYPIFRTVLAST